MVAEIYRPVKTFLTPAIDINPNYITPKMLQYRLQEIMDAYVAGVSTWCKTNAKMLGIAERKLNMIIAWTHLDLDDKNWRVVVNSRLNSETGE